MMAKLYTSPFWEVPSFLKCSGAVHKSATVTRVTRGWREHQFDCAFLKKNFFTSARVEKRVAAEICDLHHHAVVHHAVGGLEASVHLDGAGMEVGHALHRRIAQSSKLWRPLVAEMTHCSNIVRNGGWFATLLLLLPMTLNWIEELHFGKKKRALPPPCALVQGTLLKWFEVTTTHYIRSPSNKKKCNRFRLSPWQCHTWQRSWTPSPWTSLLDRTPCHSARTGPSKGQKLVLLCCHFIACNLVTDKPSLIIRPSFTRSF